MCIRDRANTDQYISANNIRGIKFRLAVKLTSEGSVRVWALWRRLWPVSLGCGRRRWRLWWGLYLDDWKRVASKSCLNSSKLLNEAGRYPYLIYRRLKTTITNKVKCCKTKYLFYSFLSLRHCCLHWRAYLAMLSYLCPSTTHVICHRGWKDRDSFKRDVAL